MDRAVGGVRAVQLGGDRGGVPGGAGSAPVCAGIRGTDATPDVCRGVRGILPECAAVAAAGAAMGEGKKKPGWNGGVKRSRRRCQGRKSETQRTGENKFSSLQTHRLHVGTTPIVPKSHYSEISQNS